jgi:hypothetical protein
LNLKYTSSFIRLLAVEVRYKNCTETYVPRILCSSALKNFAKCAPLDTWADDGVHAYSDVCPHPVQAADGDVEVDDTERFTFRLAIFF